MRHLGEYFAALVNNPGCCRGHKDQLILDNTEALENVSRQNSSADSKPGRQPVAAIKGDGGQKHAAARAAQASR